MQVSSCCYWPQGSEDGEEAANEETYGKLRVSLKGCTSHGDITERKLEVKETGDESGDHRIVSVLQLTSWSPGELPHPSAILSLVNMLSKAQRRSPNKPTIIMCRS